jgi:hypothetical protein
MPKSFAGRLIMFAVVALIAFALMATAVGWGKPLTLLFVSISNLITGGG